MKKIIFTGGFILAVLIFVTRTFAAETASSAYPFLTDLFITNKGEYWAYFEVRNERPALSFVEIGTDKKLESGVVISIMDAYMFNVGRFVEGMEWDKIYYARSKAIDDSGDVSYSDVKAFSLSTDNLEDPPVIIDGPRVVVKNLPDAFVEIEFSANKACEGTLNYGPTAGKYNKTAYGRNGVSHKFVITGLAPGIWHYNISCDTSHRTVKSQDATFSVPDKSSTEKSGENLFASLISIFSPILFIFK